MISSAKTLCLLALLSLCLGQYKKITHQTDPEALCLDGSTPALYVHQGSQPKNILMVMMGGGACAESTLEKSLDACLKRTETLFGSSIPWRQTFDGDKFGILSTNPSSKFAEWTKVLFLYCDGALFQGYNKNPVEHKGKKIYFRGGKIMRAHFKWIDQQYGIKQADKVVLAGSSAGGIGVYGWVDYVREMMSDPKKFYGVVDSGIFLDPVSLGKIALQSAQLLPSFAPNALLSQAGGQQATTAGGSININPNGEGQSGPTAPLQDNINSGIPSGTGSAPILPQDSLKQFMTISNADERPPNTKCLDSLSSKAEDWQCIFSPKVVQYFDTKMLWLNAQYDSYVTKNILQIGCLLDSDPSTFTPKNCTPPELLLLDYYRGLISTHVLGELAKQGHSIWSNACSWHGISVDSEVYDNWRVKAPFYGRRRTAKQAIEDFVIKDQKIMDIDQFPWPSNRLCAF